MSDDQPTHQAPQIESDLTAENITMKIDKAPKQSAEFLDDHLGKSLADSIAKLIGQSNIEPKKKPRKKKVLTEAQREQCKKNLAKGRETIKRKKEEAQKAKEIPTPTPTPAPTPTTTPEPAVPKTEPTAPPAPPPTPVPVEPEELVFKMGDLLF
jgi:hypothetical protein